MVLSKQNKLFRSLLLVAPFTMLVFYLFIDTRVAVVENVERVSLRYTPIHRNTTLPLSTMASPELYYKILQRGHYIRPGNIDVAILTAVFYRNVPTKNGFNVFLNGWARLNSTMAFKCCFLNHINQTNIVLIETKSTVYHVYAQWKVDMQNAEFYCSIPESQLKMMLLDAPKSDSESSVQNYFTSNFTQYVTFAEKSCRNASRDAIRIEYRKTIPKSVGVCLKISYGSLNPETVVEWFEFQRIIGVTKVFTFLSEDLDQDARNVFKFYESTGFLESSPIYPAPKLKNGTHRGFRKPRWEQQAWVDEVVAINDCKHRMSGMDFIIVHDIDEFIVPKRADDDIYSILNKTASTNPKAASFKMDARVAMQNWGPTRQSPLHIMRTMNLTTRLNYDGADRNTRWAFIPDRTYFAQNNKAWPKKGYTTSQVKNDLFTLIHRRSCKPTWKHCNSTKIRQTDDTMLRYEGRMLSSVRSLPLLSILGNSSKGYIAGLILGAS